MNLAERFLASAESRPDAAALITPDGATVSFAALARRSAARAATLHADGVGRGDVVLIAHGVSPALYETLLAVFRLGAVALFPEPAAGLAGVRHAVAAARPAAIVAPRRARLLRWLVPSLWRTPLSGAVAGRRTAPGMAELPGDAPALITFTSGSTGRPKGIVRSCDFLWLQHRLLEDLRQTKPDDIDLISLPVFVLSNLAAGATSVIPHGRLTRPATLDGARLCAQIAQHRVNRLIAPPAVCQRIVDAATAPMPGLSAIFTGGGPVFPNLLHALARTAPQAQIHAVYGSTEAEPIAHQAYAAISVTDFETMATGGGLLAGRPIDAIELRIVDDEICVAGPHVNRGYLDAADDCSTKFDADGRRWHRTGDAGRLDDAGRLWLLGRVSAAHGGRYPFAYETAALSWPGVRQAALLACEDRLQLAVAGERIDWHSVHERARELGGVEIVQVRAIPMDVRHNSKVDYTRLRAMLGG